MPEKRFLPQIDADSADLKTDLSFQICALLRLSAAKLFLGIHASEVVQIIPRCSHKKNSSMYAGLLSPLLDLALIVMSGSPSWLRFIHRV